MTASHTPGPWTVNARGLLRIFAGTVQICRIWLHGEKETALANARLIAAAPELLAALEAVLGYEDDRPAPGTRGAEIYAGAQAVIARAKGDA